MNEEVTISAAEYKELLEAQASIKAFARYVDMVKYSVDREVYAALLVILRLQSRQDRRKP